MAVASLAGIGLALTCALTPPSATADTGCARARYFLLNRHLAPASLDSCAAALARAHRSGPENEARLALRAQLLVTMGNNGDATRFWQLGTTNVFGREHPADRRA